MIKISRTMIIEDQFSTVQMWSTTSTKHCSLVDSLRFKGSSFLDNWIHINNRLPLHLLNRMFTILSKYRNIIIWSKLVWFKSFNKLKSFIVAFHWIHSQWCEKTDMKLKSIFKDFHKNFFLYLWVLKVIFEKSHSILLIQIYLCW